MPKPNRDGIWLIVRKKADSGECQIVGPFPDDDAVNEFAATMDKHHPTWTVQTTKPYRPMAFLAVI